MLRQGLTCGTPVDLLAQDDARDGVHERLGAEVKERIDERVVVVESSPLQVQVDCKFGDGVARHAYHCVLRKVGVVVGGENAIDGGPLAGELQHALHRHVAEFVYVNVDTAFMVYLQQPPQVCLFNNVLVSDQVVILPGYL